jgi:Ni/Fe-hydrogenase subunit HybB-like protein
VLGLTCKARRHGVQLWRWKNKGIVGPMGKVWLYPCFSLYASDDVGSVLVFRTMCMSAYVRVWGWYAMFSYFEQP